MTKITAVCFTILIGSILASNINMDLYTAAEAGDLDDVNTALADGADPDWRNDNMYDWESTALIAASTNNHTAVVNALLDAGADIDIGNHDNRTSVWEASNKGNIEVVKVLIERKADINIPSRNGQTPIARAAMEGHTMVVSALLDAHADITVADKGGYTALHWATRYNQSDTALLLLRAGACSTSTTTASATKPPVTTMLLLLLPLLLQLVPLLPLPSHL